MFDFLSDINFWLVLIVSVISFFIAVLLFPLSETPQPSHNVGEQKETKVVYIFTSSAEEAWAQFDKLYKPQGWQVVAWEYDQRKKAFVFILEK